MPRSVCILPIQHLPPRLVSRKRETACTCERTNSPTLLQALELLNGDIAQKAAVSGADAIHEIRER